MEVNNPNLVQKLLVALENLRRNGAKEEIIKRLWTKDVNAYIKRILPATGEKVKKLWNAKLEDIKSLDRNGRRKDLSAATLHKSGITFNPVNIMCLFIFGLVNIGPEEKFTFTQMLNKQEDEKERSYIANFLSFILLDKSEQEMKVYSSDIDIGDTLETKIHDKLFITDDNHPLTRNTMILDFIPENPWTNLKENLDHEVTITSDPAFWYVYILYDLKDDVGLKCTGLAYKENYYIFARNLPKYDNQAVAELKTIFIDNPLNEYKRVMNAPFPKTERVMSKVPQDYPMLVYVHVMLAALYHHEKDFFVCKQHSADEDILKTALWAGADVTEYQAKLIHLEYSMTPLVLQRSLADEDVLVRLANAHYALMGTSTLHFEIDNGAVVYHKTFSPATCEVEDAWVFGGLKLSQKWGEELKRMSRAVRFATETSALRRLLCYIPEGSAYCKDLCEKYKRKIDLGCKVGVNGHVVFDFMQYARHNNLLNKPGVTLRDFCASDRYEAITKLYFGNLNVFQPAQLIGKVIVQYSRQSDDGFGSVLKTYEVRDISELELDGDSNKENLRIIDLLDWCPVCGEGTVSHGPHFLEKHKDQSISFATTKADMTTDAVEPFLPLVPSASQTAVVEYPQENKVDRKNKEGGGFPPIAGVLHKVVGAVENEDSRQAGALAELEKDVNAIQDLEEQKVEALKEIAKKDKIKFDEQQKELEQQIETLQNQLASEKQETVKNVEKFNKDRDALKLDYQQEIATLKADTARNLDEFERKIEALKLSYESKIDALQIEIAQKKTELEQAKQELERLKQSESLQATDTDTLKKEKEEIGQEIVALGTQKTKMEQELADLQKEMADLAARLKKNLLENKTEEGIDKLHKKVEKMIEEEMSDGLLDLLRNKQYAEFKARVQQKDVTKEQHSLPAQFLNCESIAATWRLFEGPGAGPVSAVMAQKLMHHIRLYDSMEYDRSLHGFTSRYFKKFESTMGYAVVTSVPDAPIMDGADTLVPGI